MILAFFVDKSLIEVNSVTFLNNEFDCVAVSNKHTSISEDYDSRYFCAALNSNLFWWYYSINYDLFNFKDYMIFGFRINYLPQNKDRITKLSDMMEDNLRRNATFYVIETRGRNETVTYNKKKSKSIMDDIDLELGSVFGFSEEELDFIINYDFKFRMGDNQSEEVE